MHEDQPRKGLKQAANLDPYFVLETEMIVQKTLTVAEFPSLPKNVCSSHDALPTPAGPEPGQPLRLIPGRYG